MGLVRHDLGLSGTSRRFPHKGPCLSIYSRTVNTCESLVDVLKHAFPWCADWEAELKRLFGGYVEAKQQQNVDDDCLLLYWAGRVAKPTLAAQVGARFDHVLAHREGDLALKSQAVLELELARTAGRFSGHVAHSRHRTRHCVAAARRDGGSSGPRRGDVEQLARLASG
jgi:hypothetical protein